jgi:hypothetical protein
MEDSGMSTRLRWGRGDIEDLHRLIDEYFAACEDIDMPPSVAGLCIKLSITRDTWGYYASGRYLHHIPSYVKDLDPDAENAPDPPTVEDLAAVDTYDWPKALGINGTNGDPKRWEEDMRLRRAVGSALKIAMLRIEDGLFREGVRLGRAKCNPAFPIFYTKAALGYREDAPQLAPPDTAPPEDRFSLTITGSIPLQLEAGPAAPAPVSGEHGSK